MKKCLMMLFVGFLISGCMGSSQPSIAVKHYTLEYPFFRFENLSRIDQVIRVERFTAFRPFQGNEMVYRPKPYVRNIYNYHRWTISPADLITEILLRDIRGSGVFKSVFTYEDPGDARFVLEGRLEEFMEVDEGERSWASLIVHVSFSDLSGKNPANRIILQKTYKFLEPFKERHPQELVKAMSMATEKFSKELILDLYRVAGGAV
jgi:ABC-type uncharacterized transport system auxiliary subunit